MIKITLAAELTPSKVSSELRTMTGQIQPIASATVSLLGPGPCPTAV